MKRSIMMSVVCIILCSQLSFAMPSSWAFDSIEYAIENQLVSHGMLSRFQEPITRESFAEMVVLLYEGISGEKASNPTIFPFIDTLNSDVIKAYQLGIVSGKGNGRFSPTDMITRQEIAVMLYRTLSVSNVNAFVPTRPSFFLDDHLISPWARESVYALQQIGIISGVGNNRMNPLGHATREEVIALSAKMHRYSMKPSTHKVLSSTEIGKFAQSVVKLYVRNQNGVDLIGSGFFYEPGKIATNYHVIENASIIEVEFDDGRFYTGDVFIIGYDIELDVAAIIIDDPSTPSLALGNSDSIERGQKIYTIGSPMGLINTLGSGIVSSVRYQSIQITAPISPGSSGGALVDEYGFVVGITNAAIIEGENLGFAVPINIFKTMDKSLMLALSDPIDVVEADQVLRTSHGSYYGEIKNGFPHGFGTMIWDDGDEYVGDWIEGRFEGVGVMIFANGDRYEGQVKNWLYDGNGIYTFSSGEQYDGAWVDGLHDGYGIYSWPDGKSYTGEWHKGMFHGKGTYRFEDGTVLSGLWHYGDFVD